MTVSSWRATAEIPATVRGPAAARAVVAALLHGWGLQGLVYHAQLVVSELVTNAVQHAPGADSFELELAGSAGSIRITLADGSAVRPTLLALSSEHPRGRGLRIVQAVAARWGAEDHRGGKRVWAEIAAPQHPQDV